MNTLNIHILDIPTGRPAEGVTVSLSREGETLVTLVTNAQGRITAFSAALLPAGSYCLITETGVRFVRAGRESAFTWVQIDFVIGEAVDGRFHLPFLIAPDGWSTYRGSQTRLPDAGRRCVCPAWIVTARTETARRPDKAQPPPGI